MAMKGTSVVYRKYDGSCGLKKKEYEKRKRQLPQLYQLTSHLFLILVQSDHLDEARFLIQSNLKLNAQLFRINLSTMP